MNTNKIAVPSACNDKANGLFYNGRIIILALMLMPFGLLEAQEQFGGSPMVRTGITVSAPTDSSAIDTTASGQGNRVGQTNSSGVTATINTNMDNTRILHSPNTQQFTPNIKIDNNNPCHILVGANTYLLNNNFHSEQGYYYYDATTGVWAGSDIYPNIAVSVIPSPAVGGDPSVAFDANHNAFMSTLQGGDLANQIEGFYDEAATAWPPTSWVGPVFTTQLANSTNFDKELIAADNFPYSPYINNIYCVGTGFTNNAFCPAPAGAVQFYGTSTANNISGGTLSSITNNDLRSGAPGYTSGVGFGFGANVQTGANGQVYVCWADYASGASPASNIGFAYSADGGTTWANQTLAAFSSYGGGIDPFCSQQFQGDLDGNTGAGIPPSLFGVQYNASDPNENYTGYIRMFSHPCMAVDRSCGAKAGGSPYSNPGRIYIAYPAIDQTTTDNTYSNPAIAIGWSDDNGATWQQPANPVISIQNLLNATNNPNGYAMGGPICFMPWIAVDDATGIISVAYYAFDGSIVPPSISSTYNSTNTYLAYSTDGGNTFTNVLISSQPHLTSPIYPFTTYGGDYNVGVTSYAGKAYVAWSDDRITENNIGAGGNGNYGLWQIYVTEVDYSNNSEEGMCTYSPPLASTYDVIGNISVPSGSYQTYGATQEVVIPYTGTFQSLSGSHVNIYACKEVNLANGFSAANELHAYISNACTTCVCTSYSCTPPESRLLANNNVNGKPSTVAATPSMVQTQTKLGSNIKLGIFPNPSSGVVYLNLSTQNAGNLLVNLRDATGNAVMHTSYSANVGANSYKLDISTLNSGVYFINITDENGVTIKNDKLVLMGQ